MPRIEIVVVDLALAQAICDAVRTEAGAHAALVSVAVVDGGGHLVAFQRMDGAEIAGPVLARDKAFTAVAHRTATADLTALVADGGPLAGMSAADSGRYVCFPGGRPLWSGDRVVGGVGVSGGTAEQDDACARAGVAVWQEHLSQEEPTQPDAEARP